MWLCSKPKMSMIGGEITLSLADADTPQEAYENDCAFWRSHSMRVMNTKDLIIGYNYNFTALSIVVRDFSSGSTRYEKHVYFGSKPKVYCLTLMFDEKDWDKLQPDFDLMLKTVCYAK